MKLRLLIGGWLVVAVGIFMLEAGGKADTLLGGNANTDPEFPYPGDSVTVHVGGRPGTTFDAAPRPLIVSQVDQSDSITWWGDLTTSRGRASTRVSGYATVQVDPISRREIGPRKPLYTFPEPREVRLRIADDLGSFIPAGGSLILTLDIVRSDTVYQVPLSVFDPDGKREILASLFDALVILSAVTLLMAFVGVGARISSVLGGG